MIVSFKTPSVAPTTEIEEDAFIELDSIISSGKLSSAIGWAICCGENLAELKKDILKYCKRLKGAFSGRDLKNWATLMFFLDQVWFKNLWECLIQTITF